MATSVSELLNSGGARSFPFPTIGTRATGRVLSADVVQSRNFDTNDPEFWADGNPKQLVRVIIETTERDPADPEDDGHRAVYIKAWGDQMAALRAAIKQSGDTDIHPGGTFTAIYVSDGIATRGFPPKQFMYQYAMPSSTAQLFDPRHDRQQAFDRQQQPAQGSAAGTNYVPVQPNSQQNPQTPAQDPATMAAFEAWQASQRNGQQTQQAQQDPPF